MRRASLLAFPFAALAALAVAQSRPSVLFAPIPIPASPYELAAAGVQPAFTADQRAAALGLLDRARANFTLLTPTIEPFQLDLDFEAADVPGHLRETWLGAGAWAWTSTLGATTQDRYATHGLYSTQPQTPIPLAIQMVREAMFWPLQYATDARGSLRTVPARWRGLPVICVLVGPPDASEPPVHRGWLESESCIDPASGRLEIVSPVPGFYAVYDQAITASFDDHTLPRTVNVYSGGRAVLTIHLAAIADASSADSASVRPTPAMLVQGQSFELSGPVEGYATQVGPIPGVQLDSPQIVVVHLTRDRQGAVGDSQVVVGANPVLIQYALDQLRRFHPHWPQPPPVQPEEFFMMYFAPTPQPRPAAAMAVPQKVQIPDEPNATQICSTLLAQPAPAPPVFAVPKSSEWLETCDPVGVFYGFDHAPDSAAAAQCAAYHHNPAILADVYANGEGVARNYDIALWYACKAQDEGGFANTSILIGDLEDRRASKSTARDFDLFNDATSGRAESAGAAIRERVAQRRRRSQAAAILATLPPATRKLWPGLQNAEDTWAQARAQEINPGGSGAGAWAEEEITAQNDQFMTDLRRFASGDIPAVSAAQAQADAERMNTALAAALQTPRPSGLVVPPHWEAPGSAQPQWDALVQAWLRFGQAAFPRLRPDEIRDHFIRLRLHMLGPRSPDASQTSPDMRLYLHALG